MTIDPERRYRPYGLLKNIREKSGLTRAELAQLLRVGESFVAEYEHGTRWLEAFEALDIAARMGISWSEFARRYDSDEPVEPGKMLLVEIAVPWPGTTRHGRDWVKWVTDVDRRKNDGSAFIGDILRKPAEVLDGAWLLGYGEDRTHRYRLRALYITLWRVRGHQTVTAREWTIKPQHAQQWALAVRDKVGDLVEGHTDPDAPDDDIPPMPEQDRRHTG